MSPATHTVVCHTTIPTACSLVAQLARTEEAAKRILTRTDPSARGGVAQRLLDAERELARVKAELAEAGSGLST